MSSTESPLVQASIQNAENETEEEGERGEETSEAEKQKEYELK